MNGWNQGWDFKPPQPDDPEYPKYLGLLKTWHQNVTAQVAAMEPPENLDLATTPDVRDDPLNEQDTRPFEEQVAVYSGEVAARASLAEALDQFVIHLRRFVYFADKHQAIAVALWVCHTHAINAAEQSPILAFVSPVRRSGKTKAMEIIESVCARPWRAIRPSESVLFRRIDRDQPTLLLDEIDTIFNAKTEHEGIRACLNAGNRAGTTVPRAVAKGKGFDLVDFTIYCAKALAGIGDLPETVRDRAIVIHMSRKAAGDRIERIRTRDAIRLGRPIGQAFHEALRHVTDLTLANVDLPDELDDRAQDGWEPLLAIAHLAGGDWPGLARRAAVALSSERSDVEDDSLGMVLLRDCRFAFGDDKRLTTSQLIERLCAIETSPWGDFYGKPVTGRRIAKLLRPFAISPHRDRTANTYSVMQFEDAWSRYLPQESSTSSTSSTSEVAATESTLNVPALGSSAVELPAVHSSTLEQSSTQSSTHEVPAPEEPTLVEAPAAELVELVEGSRRVKAETPTCSTCGKPMITIAGMPPVCTNAPGHLKLNGAAATAWPPGSPPWDERLAEAATDDDAEGLFDLLS